jgi:hypothetical protein
MRDVMRWVGVVSILLLVLAWLALDDVTTDNTNTFEVEYSVLVACGIWFAGVAIWLLARGRLVLGIVSLLAVALAGIAFWSLPHHYAPARPVNYLGMFSLGWFLGLSIWLVAHRPGPGGR